MAKEYVPAEIEVLVPVVTSPKEFAETMSKFREEAIREDCEIPHVKADSLMCDILAELGYGEGVEIFRDMPKWYS